MTAIDTAIRHTTPAGGNVFADLGFPQEEAAKLKIKAQLMCEISEWIKANHLKQEEAAKRLQVTRPRVSDVITGKADKFTIDALVDMLQHMGRRVTIAVS